MLALTAFLPAAREPLQNPPYRRGRRVPFYQIAMIAAWSASSMARAVRITGLLPAHQPAAEEELRQRAINAC
jgi:hypothetical protein